MMQALLAPLRELAELEEIQKEQKKEAGMLLLSNCSGSEKTHLMYGLSGEFRKKLIIRSSSEKAASTYEEYRFLSENVYLYPAKDLLFFTVTAFLFLIITADRSRTTPCLPPFLLFDLESGYCACLRDD